MLPPCHSILTVTYGQLGMAVLNFMFCERCGILYPGNMAIAHTDLNCEYNGHTFPVNVAGMMPLICPQQSIQTGEIAFSKLEMRKQG